ncbi:MAG TPA: tetratricopeptide repeat protein [Rhizomicrobium sp.]|nr:tetratricopeptide repeat protein [Rhizomicrobium sp.]
MTRFAPRLLILLAATSLAGCTSMAGMLGGDAETPTAAIGKQAPLKNIANDLDGNVRQAQLLRLAGKHDEAIRILSQLTLIAADDPRVVGEYGKALAQKGRAQDATQFLRRAIELAPNDWTLYSALGVAYDQVGDQVNARAAYERALSIRPSEASVLNNYALSRMLAKDPETARALIARAQAAGTPGNEKIARNVALINDIAPPQVAAAPKPAQIASATAKPVATAPAKPIPAIPAPAPQAAARLVLPPIPVVQSPVAANVAPRDANDVARRLASQTPVGAPVAAAGAPRTLMPAGQFLAAPPEVNQAAVVLPQQRAAERRVVMQAVPFDPLAGPVKPRPAPKAAVAKKAAPVKQAEVPSLRIATEQY